MKKRDATLTLDLDLPPLLKCPPGAAPPAAAPAGLFRQPWMYDAYNALVRLAETRDKFLIADVWQEMGELPNGRNGGIARVLNHAVANKVIKKCSGHIIAKSSPRSNGSPRRLWRSLIYQSTQASTEKGSYYEQENAPV